MEGRSERTYDMAHANWRVTQENEVRADGPAFQRL